MARKYESFRDAAPWRNAGTPHDVRIPFEITDPLPMVNVTLDDRTTVPFLIDTGEHEVGVDRALAQELGLPTYGSSQGIFAGGKTATLDYGRLNTLAMGEFRMHDVPVNNAVPIPATRWSPKLGMLSVAPALAEVMRRIHNGESVSAVFGPS